MKFKTWKAGSLSRKKGIFPKGIDSKTIIDFQQDVIDAEIAAIHSLVTYQKAIDGFYRAQHKLLDYVGVTETGFWDGVEHA